MGFYTPKPTSNFVPPPEGTHVAICYRLLDLGTQQSEFQGQTKRLHKIMMSWELPEELMDDGQPFTVHQRYTFSLHEKAKLRADLEAWRGRAFTEEEIGGFDMEVLLGKPCLVTIIHTENGGRVYANVKTISRLPKSMKAPDAPINIVQSFYLRDPNWTLFDSLSDGLKEVIKKSPEYAEAIKTNVSDAPAEVPKRDLDDDIPF